MSIVFRLRAAHPSEATTLTDLAIRSKRSWGYDDAFMEQIADNMTVRPEYLQEEHAIVAEDGNVIAAYAILRVAGEIAHLRDLFVDPQYMSRGAGAMLLAEALTFARSRDVKRFSLVSDPNAVGFYERFGLRVVSHEPSAYVAGRTLPAMTMDLP